MKKFIIVLIFIMCFIQVSSCKKQNDNVIANIKEEQIIENIIYSDLSNILVLRVYISLSEFNQKYLQIAYPEQFNWERKSDYFYNVNFRVVIKFSYEDGYRSRLASCTIFSEDNGDNWEISNFKWGN